MKTRLDKLSETEISELLEIAFNQPPDNFYLEGEKTNRIHVQKPKPAAVLIPLLKKIF